MNKCLTVLYERRTKEAFEGWAFPPTAVYSYLLRGLSQVTPDYPAVVEKPIMARCKLPE
jgi:hypothetical protein